MFKTFGFISLAIVLLSAPFYLVDIIRGHTKPERVTWFIWMILGIIAFFSQQILGAHWSLLYAGIDALGSIIVFILSLKYGVGGWTQTDRFALYTALIGVTFSLVAHRAIIALVGIIIADSAGLILTIRKTYLNPNSETSITWFGIGTAALLAALSVGHIKISLLIYPLYLSLGSYSVLLTQWFGRRKKHS